MPGGAAGVTAGQKVAGRSGDFAGRNGYLKGRKTTETMARVKLEAGTGIAGISGRIGNLVFRVSADGTTYVQQAPTTARGPGSAAQQQYRQRFGAAARYGRSQQASAEG